MKKPEYSFELESKTSFGKKKYEFVSDDGVESKDDFRDSELALADFVTPEKDDRILVVQSGYGFLPVIFAHKISQGFLVASETSDRAAKLTEMNVSRNQVENVRIDRVESYVEVESEFNIILYAPKSYEPVDVVKQRIGRCCQNLETGGKFFIAGEEAGGIRRYEKYISNSGKVEKIAQRGSQRVYKYVKPENLSIEIPDTEKEFQTVIRDNEFLFRSKDGFFSSSKIDEGTKLLIQNLQLGESKKVLDLACGYGVIGTSIAKTSECEIFLSDDDKQVLSYAKKNLESNGIEDYTLRHTDCMDGWEEEKFDLIVSNPPTHQGKNITDEIWSESDKRLMPGGRLVIVYNKNLNFSTNLEKIYSDVRVLDERDNYRVVEAEK